MKSALVILALVATATLPGCVVLPAYGGPYYGQPVVVAPVVRPWGYGYGYGYGHRRW